MGKQLIYILLYCQNIKGLILILKQYKIKIIQLVVRGRLWSFEFALKTAGKAVKDTDRQIEKEIIRERKGIGYTDIVIRYFIYYILHTIRYILYTLGRIIRYNTHRNSGGEGCMLVDKRGQFCPRFIKSMISLCIGVYRSIGVQGYTGVYRGV